MMTDTTLKALGHFIRAHRERLAPASLGRADAGRRRTPGLRREELAERAGLSATWLAWLEQGRTVAASPAALDRLARALGLAPAERRYLFDLAGRRDPQMLPAAADELPQTLVAAPQSIAVPAYLLDRIWQMRGWNPPAERLFAGWLDRAGDRNMLRFVFLERQARHFICDWEQRARNIVAEFRADCGKLLDDPELAGFLADLCGKSPIFAQYWQDQDVRNRSGGERRFDHPQDGLLRYEQLTLSPATRPDLKLVLLMPG
jgi:transcriptional regulator with XRE-family HTH domain